MEKEKLTYKLPEGWIWSTIDIFNNFSIHEARLHNKKYSAFGR